MLLKYIIAIVLGYLFGTVHPSYFLAKKFKNIDIRECGTNNSGTSNAAIVLGLKFGVVTAIVDVLKGTFAVLVAVLLFGRDQPLILYAVGLCAILGHMYPFYMQCRGGKGLATIMGISITLNFYMAVVMLIVLVLGTLITDYIVVGTVAACLTFIIYSVIQYGVSWVSLLAIIIAGAVLLKHKKNYIKMYNKEEHKVSESLKKKK